MFLLQPRRANPKNQAKMEIDQSSKAATMTYSDSDILLTTLADEKLDWILE